MTKTIRRLLMILIATPLLVSTLAQAQRADRVDATQEVRRNAFITDDFLNQRLKLSYWGDFSGPRLSEPGVAVQPNNQGGVKGNLELYNSVTAGYRITPAFTAYVNPRFSVYSRGQGAELLDPNIGVANSSLVKSADGNFNWYANFTLRLPVTEGSREANKMVSPGTYMELNYDIPSSRFSIGTLIDFRAHIFTSAAENEVNQRRPEAAIGSGITGAEGVLLYAYAGPYVHFTLTDTIGLRSMFEMEATRPTGTSLFDFQDPIANMRTYATFQVSSNLALWPYLKYYPTTGTVNPDTTQIGMEISGAVF